VGKLLRYAGKTFWESWRRFFSFYPKKSIVLSGELCNHSGTLKVAYEQVHEREPCTTEFARAVALTGIGVRLT
jgi:hypothetical protein